jgi:DNA-binding NarL/FixJ family response regulator
MRIIRTSVRASDPITYAGLTSQLDSRPEVTLVDDPTDGGTDVVVLAVERITSEVLSLLRRWAGTSEVRVVLITNELPEADLLTVVECRVVAVLSLGAVSGDRLVASILAAASGGAVMPPDLLGTLLQHVARIQRDILAPRGLNAMGLTLREVDVVKLMADGLDTAEIARDLCYSERTVKNIIYSITTRLNLRNRAHAVAYAMRAGAI